MGTLGTAAGLSVVAAMLPVLLLPESLPRASRKPAGRVGLIRLRELGEAVRSPIGVLLLLAFLATVSWHNVKSGGSALSVDLANDEMGRMMRVTAASADEVAEFFGVFGGA